MGLSADAPVAATFGGIESANEEGLEETRRRHDTSPSG
jgi:hypothetical protein